MNASPQQQARRLQQVESLCAATLRALTGDASLHYRGEQVFRGERRLAQHAPHLRIDPVASDFGDWRAAADGMALRLMHSDTALHRSLCPADAVERLIFELLEQLRVETRVPAALPGMAANLLLRFRAWSGAFVDSGLTEGRLGMLLFTVAQMCWSRLTGMRLPEEIEDHIEIMRGSLVDALGAHLRGIRQQRHDQRAFADHALAIAQVVGERVRRERGEAADDPAPQIEQAAQHGFALLLEFDDEGELDCMAAAATGDSKVFAEAAHTYRVFTTRYDTEVRAASLVRKALLREYRERLDRAVAAHSVNVSRLARMLSAVLARAQRDGWDFGLEDGRIDGRRLAQLVSSPSERRVFRHERYRPMADCVVSLLIDCSGSMKTHIEALAVVVDVLLRALEMAGARTELLGFTTAAWNGGRPYREWMRGGRPAAPGRLNEVCHLVFKDADRSWRRARTDVAALFKADLFREGIDGEAVEWACGRLMARDEARRILMVISDGCPSDSATGLANDAFYLDNHLKAVVARWGGSGGVEILGLGVGLDLSPFYRRCLAADLNQAVDGHLFQEIVALIAGRRRR